MALPVGGWFVKHSPIPRAKASSRYFFEQSDQFVILTSSGLQKQNKPSVNQVGIFKLQRNWLENSVMEELTGKFLIKSSLSTQFPAKRPEQMKENDRILGWTESEKHLGTYDAYGIIIQELSSQLQSSRRKSCFMPSKWPISCASVVATASTRALSSCNQNNARVELGASLQHASYIACHFSFFKTSFDYGCVALL